MLVTSRFTRVKIVDDDGDDDVTSHNLTGSKSAGSRLTNSKSVYSTLTLITSSR